jgi:hypothetical protein
MRITATMAALAVAALSLAGCGSSGKSTATRGAGAKGSAKATRDYSPPAMPATCKPYATSQLAKLNVSNYAAKTNTIRSLPMDDIKPIQSCLKENGCYNRKKVKEDDGFVGPYTTGALKNWALGECAVVEPMEADCGQGRDMASWRVTPANLKILQAPAQQDDAGQSVAESPVEQSLSPGLVAGLKALEGSDYPSAELFRNALEYAATANVLDEKATVPDTKEQEALDAKDKMALAAELKTQMPRILQQVCKAHPAGEPGPGWGADWDAQMWDSLSQPVYGFYPFWLTDNPDATPAQGTATDAAANTAQGKTAQGKDKSAEAHTVDFGVIERIGWFGVTFSSKAELENKSINPQAIAKQIEMARRFRTSVDLVVYKRQKREQWLQLVYGSTQQPATLPPVDFIQTLSKNIADEVSQKVGGLENRFQWMLPNLVRSPVTKWDGATIYLDDFPYDDEGSMKYFVNLLWKVRQELNLVDPKEKLDLNVVVPYSAFVPEDAAAPQAGAVKQGTGKQAEPNPVIHWLAELVPRAKGVWSGSAGCANNSQDPPRPDDIVDCFIVFLPQQTSNTKKDLRGAIEDAFNRTADTVAELKEDRTESLAIWRAQMLRRLIMVLSPGTWNWKNNYGSKGFQMYDDMVYATNNFGAVGFWPLPAYDGINEPTKNSRNSLATDIMSVFETQGGGWIETSLAPGVVRMLGVRTANFFGGWRRELSFAIAAVVLFFAGYAVFSIFFIPLRTFFREHLLWFAAAAGLALITALLLCLLDRALREWFQLVTIGVVFLLLIAGFTWRYIANMAERDLP